MYVSLKSCKYLQIDNNKSVQYNILLLKESLLIDTANGRSDHQVSGGPLIQILR